MIAMMNPQGSWVAKWQRMKSKNPSSTKQIIAFFSSFCQNKRLV
jgi:hypothetical protein